MSNRVPTICHYELLGLERTADDDTIKRAYRKAALEWHPDKNLHRPDEATARFRDIQAAYSVLSDPTERAWYDSHRDAILGADEDGELSLVNVYSFFTSSAFAGFDDSPRGFYSVFRVAFESIAREERQYAADGYSGTHATFPSFGDSGASSTICSAFYAFWGTYVSRMSFSWADKYAALDAPTRDERRAMERENKRLRDAARRERGEAIRALAEFVKRRDKRYIAHIVAARQRAAALDAEKSREAEERKKAQAAARALAAAAAAADVAEEDKSRVERGVFRLADVHAKEAVASRAKRRHGASTAVIRHVAATDNDVCVEDAARSSDVTDQHSTDNEDEEVIYECEPCNKTFRSPAALTSHERSKKHATAVAVLRAAVNTATGDLYSESDGTLTSSGSDDDNDKNDDGVVDDDDDCGDNDEGGGDVGDGESQRPSPTNSGASAVAVSNGHQINADCTAQDTSGDEAVDEIAALMFVSAKLAASANRQLSGHSLRISAEDDNATAHAHEKPMSAALPAVSAVEPARKPRRRADKSKVASNAVRRTDAEAATGATIQHTGSRGIPPAARLVSSVITAGGGLGLSDNCAVCKQVFNSRCVLM